jgi:NAD(P)-dependent dehydrogenase (short-subunit alcohol dehydrogenase family)
MAILDASNLDGKTAVVTGGNTGLGEAFAKALAEVGASVALAARTRERSEAVATDIVDSCGRAIAVELDVRRPDQVERMLDEVTERLEPVDIPVNNAGVCYHRPAAEVPREEWLNTFEVNVHGMWYCAQTVGDSR